MPRKMTIKDIAEECGVSLSTVSLVLNDNPRISDDTRAKVLAAVARHGYEPNAHARGLASRSSRVVSVVVPQLQHVFADVYFGEIVSGIYDYATERRYKILLDVANLRFIQTQEYLNILKSKRADGMLFIGSSLYDQYLRAFEKEPYAFMLINTYFPGSAINYVAADQVDSARQAAEHLLGLGHRKIGLISGTNIQTAEDFLNAFIDCCRSAGVDEKNLPWADGRFSEEAGGEAAEKLLAEHPEITAIMCGNDKMAIGALHAIHKRGLRVPKDISLMGLDDLPQANFTTPGLTTVHHQLFHMGRRACEQLLNLFRGEASACQEFLPTRLIERESTAPPRKSGKPDRKK